MKNQLQAKLTNFHHNEYTNITNNIAVDGMSRYKLSSVFCFS